MKRHGRWWLMAKRKYVQGDENERIEKRCMMRMMSGGWKSKESRNTIPRIVFEISFVTLTSFFPFLECFLIQLLFFRSQIPLLYIFHNFFFIRLAFSSLNFFREEMFCLQRSASLGISDFGIHPFLSIKYSPYLWWKAFSFVVIFYKYSRRLFVLCTYRHCFSIFLFCLFIFTMIIHGKSHNFFQCCSNSYTFVYMLFHSIYTWYKTHIYFIRNLHNTPSTEWDQTDEASTKTFSDWSSH